MLRIHPGHITPDVSQKCTTSFFHFLLVLLQKIIPKMVFITAKWEQSDDNEFLFETKCTTIVSELQAALVRILDAPCELRAPSETISRQKFSRYAKKLDIDSN